MADTGFDARQWNDFIGPNRRQNLHWCRASPPTFSDNRWFLFYPIAPLFTQSRWRSAAGFHAAAYGNYRLIFTTVDFPDINPRQTRRGNGRRGRENGLIGRLFTKRSLKNSFPSGRDRPFPERISRYCEDRRGDFSRHLFSELPPRPYWGRSSATRRRENALRLPRMEEGTQGVTPPFNEEVAWGSGWFPLPVTGEVPA
jgi:hypothetical protein